MRYVGRLSRFGFALAVLGVGGVLAYGVGAGYFPPIAIRPPFNLLITVLLACVVLLVAARIALGNRVRR